MLMQRICIVPLVASLLTSSASAAGNFDSEWAYRQNCGRRADSGKSNAKQVVSYPSALRGVWDLAPHACIATETSDSDSRFSIERHALHGYEHRDVPRSIKKISDAPAAWRIVAISNIAPEEIQGDSDIYILDGKYLTISNGSSSETYIRCK